jgi:hypothetical protein
MPLPYTYFVKTTTIVGAPVDTVAGVANGRDPLGCALSGATYTHTGGGSGERQLNAASGTPFANVQAGDYIYLTGATGGVANGLYRIRTQVTGAIVLLNADSGLTADATTIASSDGPWLTLQYAFDNTATTRNQLVICNDGNGTGGNWEYAVTLDLDTNAGGDYGIIYRGGNSRGVVDGTRATISGASLPASTDLINQGTTSTHIYMLDLRMTGATRDNVTSPQNVTGIRITFVRCRIDNAGQHGTVHRNMFVYIQTEIDNNAGWGSISEAGATGSARAGFVLYQCSVHHNGSGGVVQGTHHCEVMESLFYRNGGDGIQIYRGTGTGGAQGFIVASVFHSNTGNGIGPGSSTWSNMPPVIARNCIFTSNSGYGISLGAYGTRWLQVDHNIFFNNSSGPVLNVVEDPPGIGHSDGDDSIYLNFTGGSYDDTGHVDGDFRLLSTGSFTNLYRGRTHLVNLTAGAGITPGIYTIATVVSNDVVLLSESAGSDSTSDVVASSDPLFVSITNNAEDFDVQAGSPALGRAIQALDS